MAPWLASSMPIESGLIKPVVGALLGLIRQGENLRLKCNGSTALREAIRELLQADPNDNRAQARIAIAKTRPQARGHTRKRTKGTP